MDRLITDFNKLYPALAAKRVIGADVTIIEHENHGKPNTLQKLTIKNVTGWNFSRKLLEAMKSFHSVAQTAPAIADKECHEVMMKECDGMFCTEIAGKITFHIYELKSSFSVDAIAKAKNQVVGTYLKMCHLLAPLSSFDITKIGMQGNIVAYSPDTEQLSAIKMIGDPKSRFCIRLHDKGIYNMPSAKCSRFWHPLECPDIFLKIIEVPYGSRVHTIL